MTNAIKQFEAALQLNPLHASAEFGLASSLQRSGRVAEAHEHLRRFQKITQTKIGTPLTVTYGEQGHNATVQDMLAPLQPVGPMIPVSFMPTLRQANLLLNQPPQRITQSAVAYAFSMSKARVKKILSS